MSGGLLCVWVLRFFVPCWVTANVFGAAKKQSGFTPYTGEGFSLEIPSKWNPSKEKEFPGTVLRYEDNFDATNNLFVSVTPATKGSITDYGPPEKFLDEVGLASSIQNVLSYSAMHGFICIHVSTNWGWGRTVI